MGGLHIGLNRTLKVPLGDCEYSHTQHRSYLANESPQRETTMLETIKMMVLLSQVQPDTFFFFLTINFLGLMHSLCAYDSNLLSS